MWIGGCTGHERVGWSCPSASLPGSLRCRSGSSLYGAAPIGRELACAPRRSLNALDPVAGRGEGQVTRDAAAHRNMGTTSSYSLDVPTHARNIPEPVVYGPDFPRFKMLTRDGRTVFESRTNQNIFLNDRSFTKNGTYTFGRFLADICVSAQDLAPLVFTDSRWDDSGELMDWEHFAIVPKFTECPAIQRLLGYCRDRESDRHCHWRHGELSRVAA